jgi:hypothetical protein
MSEAVHNAEQEFWRPPAQAQPVRIVENCSRCGAEFVVGARFCHVCGAQREPLLDYSGGRLSRWLDFHQIKSSLGLSTGALVAFIAGIACVLAAIATGFIFTASTVLDWQAVQIWRIEWLAAAAAAFLAGLLLKKKES